MSKSMIYKYIYHTLLLCQDMNTLITSAPNASFSTKFGNYNPPFTMGKKTPNHSRFTMGKKKCLPVAVLNVLISVIFGSTP